MEKIQAILKERLESVNAYLILHDWNELRLIDELKKIPRAGKHLRLDKNEIKLPKRSVYDHLLSIWRNADILFEIFDMKLDRNAFMNIIAFHDLAEAIIWDIPYFTTTELAGWPLKTKEEKDKEEEKVNSLILDSFDWSLKEDFRFFLLEWMSPDKSPELKLFNYLDRLDPIMNIWIYINMFRDEIDITHFLNAMDDFFINPNVIKFAFNSETEDLVRFFQNKEHALSFHKDWMDFIKRWIDSSKINPESIIEILSCKNMHFI
ncbi:MAG: hypothetical protein ACD_2C00193G0016 [uncultured bacterium (gcode 4)]|uniref:HD domain-containing protein n=1 Tax=uncultured bacterium (gcode 4) TaxID=1234023 RepID=K2H0H8_9BACT|nr:MAG: hypothetical protein ACD_2C00193G0016 [uncultured bacterium (gcode 4)]